jgi:hypothetical protein
MDYRATPFGDRVDTLWTVVAGVLALFLLAAVSGTFVDEDPLQTWFEFGVTVGILGGLFTLHAWYRQREFVSDLEVLDRSSHADQAVTQGTVALVSGRLEAPVVDDPRVDSRHAETESEEGFDVDPDRGPVADLRSSLEAATVTGKETPDPAAGAVTRWYEVEMIRYLTVGRGHERETVHEEQ